MTNDKLSCEMICILKVNHDKILFDDEVKEYWDGLMLRRSSIRRRMLLMAWNGVMLPMVVRVLV